MNLNPNESPAVSLVNFPPNHAGEAAPYTSTAVHCSALTGSGNVCTAGTIQTNRPALAGW